MNNVWVQSRSMSSIIIGKILGAGTFTVLLCFSAYLKIPLPFSPVPVTLQNLVVFLAGALLGPSWGVASVLLYLGMGILGVPLFANAGTGLLYLFGPTGGYLLGFCVATWGIGYGMQVLKSRSLFAIWGVMLMGMLSIYGTGALWLGLGYGWGIKQILFLGVAPFVIPDFFKASIAAALVRSSLGQRKEE